MAEDCRTGFEQALAADRYDSTTRLVFADWLEENGHDDEAVEQRRMATPEWVAADKWLRAYAVRMNPYELDEKHSDNQPAGEEAAFQLLIEGLRTNYLYAHGSDLHGLYELDDANELKQHGEVWLNRHIDWSEFIFTCSC